VYHKIRDVKYKFYDYTEKHVGASDSISQLRVYSDTQDFEIDEQFICAVYADTCF